MSDIGKRGVFVVLLLTLMASNALAQEFFSGWWWNPDEPGTGYALQVRELPDKNYDVAYLVWYLYDDSGLNTWYASLMRVEGNTLSGDLALFDGWPLEGDIVSEVTAKDMGDVLLTFDSLNTGTLSYTIDGVEHQKPIQRWEPNGEADPRGLTGWWRDEDQPGLGWFMEARNNRLFLGWYNYREPPEGYDGNGMPRWYISLDNGFTPEDTEYSAPLADYGNGQTITGPYVEPSAELLEEPLAFSLPADTSAAEGIDLTYGGNAYHLTQFEIPDIYDDLTSSGPAPISRAPMGELAPTALPLIELVAESPIHNPIIESSIEMRVNGVLVPRTVEFPEPYRAVIQYQVSQTFDPSSAVVVNVLAEDSIHYSMDYTWVFFISP